MAKFMIEYWGDGVPSTNMLVQDLDRISLMVADGFTSGEAGADEDFDGQGWWSTEGFDD